MCNFLIFYSRQLAETSPYYESLKKRNLEVLFCYEMYDELVLLELKEFGRRSLVSVENDMQKDTSDKNDTIIGNILLTILSCFINLTSFFISLDSFDNSSSSFLYLYNRE